jgi:fumarate reductase flavoprotein subunit
VIAKAALSRENSRGAHFREDFPDAGAMQESYFTLATGHGEAISVSCAPVQFTIVKPGETLLGDDEAETLVEAAQ